MLPPGDADYLMQTVEAARVSILKYHEFPWWNPWVSGGVPLFANPQFGLISLPTILGMFFGSILGYKLAILAYFILGFYGLLLLFSKSFKTPKTTAILLAYIWTFGTFLTYRSLGHYTFLTIQFLPLMLHFYISRESYKRSWLYFGITASLAALAAAHNMTILSYIVLGLFIVIDVTKISFKNTKNTLESSIEIHKRELSFLVKSGAVFVVLTLYRLLFTMSYLGDYPRTQADNPEPTIGVAKAFFAIAGPFRQFQNQPKHPQWSWMEASAYIGFLTAAVAVLIGYIFWQKRRKWKTEFVYNPTKVIILGGFCFLLGLGNFIGGLSPYIVMRHLPILSSMRVASRWLVFSSLLVLVFIALYKGSKHRMLINILLACSVVELFVISRPQLAKPYLFPVNIEASQHSFAQKLHYDTKRGGVEYDENLTNATMNNYGQIIAGDSLIDTRPGTPYEMHTQRCSVDEGCEFVMTKNATVEHWTPNKITLKRTGGGDIVLNMNPGSCWLVNNVYTFRNIKDAEPDRQFRITDTSDTISLSCAPRLSVEWFLNKVF